MCLKKDHCFMSPSWCFHNSSTENYCIKLYKILCCTKTELIKAHGNISLVRSKYFLCPHSEEEFKGTWTGPADAQFNYIVIDRDWDSIDISYARQQAINSKVSTESTFITFSCFFLFTVFKLSKKEKKSEKRNLNILFQTAVDLHRKKASSVLSKNAVPLK